MARINIEECWWSDVRRAKLVRLLQGNSQQADGLAMAAWRMAQEFWKCGRQLVPFTQFEFLDGYDLLLQSGLAERRGENVYVKGSSQYLEWVIEAKAARQLGGRNSVEGRERDEKGRLLAKGPKLELLPSSNPAESSCVHVSVSGSGSGSKERIIHEQKPNRKRKRGGEHLRCSSEKLSLIGELETIYEGYPRKRGKTPGLRKLSKDLLPSSTDLRQLAAAVANYRSAVEGKDPQHIMYFSTFATQWRDWVEMSPESSPYTIDVTPIDLGVA